MVSEPASEWRLVAACSSCRRSFSLADTVVLYRRTLFGPRGLVIDVLGERWPEPGRLLHPRCFVQLFGRRPLWASFVRGRFDKGIARPGSAARFDAATLDDAGWRLTVRCCECASVVEASGAAVVRDECTHQQWQWVPVLLERRPGQREVSHLQCFVQAHGRRAAYAALGREAWERVGPLVKRIGGVINPGPFARRALTVP